MKNIVLKISALMCLLLFTGCPIGEPTGDSTVTIVNNSPKILRHYIDTFQIVRADDLKKYEFSIIKPYSTIKKHEWWKESFETRSPIQRLFLFDQAVLDTVPWDTIRANNMYLKRIDFTLRTLDSLNWTLTYP